MAKKITELTELTTYATNDLLVIEDVSTSTTKKITWANLIADTSITAAKISGISKALLTSDINVYKFRASRNAAANTGNNAFAVIAFDTEQFDSNTNLASGVYTVPVTGFYQFNWMGAATVSAGASENLIVSLFKNGTEVARGSSSSYFLVQGSGGSDLVSCTAADTIDVRAFAPATRPLLVGDVFHNYFSGYLVSRT